MARVTVEDCLHDMENLFQLVLVSSRRARQIYLGSEPRVPEDGDKPTVIALREIAEGKVGVEVLDEHVAPAGEFEEVESTAEIGEAPEAAEAQEAADIPEGEETREAADAGEGEKAGPESADAPDASEEPADESESPQDSTRPEV